MSLQKTYLLVFHCLRAVIGLKHSLEKCSDQFLDIVCRAMTFQYPEFFFSFKETFVQD